MATASTVSNLNSGVPPQPMGNADSIVAALAPFPSTGAQQTIAQAAQTGFIPAYYKKTPGDCGAQAASGISTGTALGAATAQAAAKMALGAVKVGSQALAAVPIVGGILNLAVSFITAPFAHHSAAVNTEQSTLCLAVPDANNFLKLMDQYVASGQWDYVTAVQQMEAGYTAWRSEVMPILKDSGSSCNAACVYEKCFRACIEKRKLDYQANEAANGQGATGVSGLVSSASSLTSYLKKESGVVSGALGVSPDVFYVGLAVFVFGGFVLLSQRKRRTA